MDLSTIANVATALTVITGVGFGLFEAQRSRRAREERAAFAASGDSAPGVDEVDDRGAQYSGWLERFRDRSRRRACSTLRIPLGVTLEGLGYSVFARIVPLRVVGDLVGGTVRLAWRKLKPYIEEERRRSGSQKTFEWFQWLAVQLERHSPGKTNLQVGAQEAYRDWKP